jgi:predicted amidohydrolase YtcJ
MPELVPPAELALIGGSVITVNSSDDVVEAVAVRGNRIVAVGSRADLEPFLGPATRIVDLRGRSALPGFVDSHIHVAKVNQRSWVDIGPAAVRSIEEIKELLAERAHRTPAGEWILGNGYHPERLREGRHPTRLDLDAVAPRHPIGLKHRSENTWTFNTVGLRKIGVQDDTPDVPGGPMLRDERGVPLGPMGANCRDVFILPNMPRATEDELVEGFRWLSGELNRHGVTTAFDASLRNREELAAWRRVRAAGELTLRLYPSPYPVHGADWEREGASTRLFESGLYTGFGDEWIKLGSLTYGVDGDPMTLQEALLEPFANDPTGKYFGTYRVTQEVAESFSLAAHSNGWQISAVCLGDAGVKRAIDSIEKAVRAVPRDNHRHRLEHAELWNPSLLDRAAELGIVWNSVLALMAGMGRYATLDAWGPERSRYGFPVRSALERGIMVSAGSDWPVDAMDPMIGIHALVSRQLEPLEAGDVLAPEEAVSVLEAIRIHTYNGAYTSFSEDQKGSLEVGKLADIAVLSDDILRVPTDRIRKVRTVLTVLDGKVVYQDPSFSI